MTPEALAEVERLQAMLPPSDDDTVHPVHLRILREIYRAYVAGGANPTSRTFLLRFEAAVGPPAWRDPSYRHQLRN